MKPAAISVWIRRLLTKRKHKVIVANPRTLRAIIYESDNKNDQRDAEMLNRIGHSDRSLLYGITHNRLHQSIKIIDASAVLVAAVSNSLTMVRSSVWASSCRRLQHGGLCPQTTEALKPEDDALDRVFQSDDVLIDSLVDVVDHRGKRRTLPDPVAPHEMTTHPDACTAEPKYRHRYSNRKLRGFLEHVA